MKLCRGIPIAYVGVFLLTPMGGRDVHSRRERWYVRGSHGVGVPAAYAADASGSTWRVVAQVAGRTPPSSLLQSGEGSAPRADQALSPAAQGEGAQRPDAAGLSVDLRAGLASLRGAIAEGDVKRLADAFAAAGDSGAALLRSELGKTAVDRRLAHNCVRVLRAMDTQGSASLLLALALGEVATADEPVLQAWAAQAYLGCGARVPRDAWRLVSSGNPLVRRLGLRSVTGVRLARPEMNLLIDAAQAGDLPVRLASAQAMVQDPSGQFIPEKLTAIRASIEYVAEAGLPAGQARDSLLSQTEMWYGSFIEALAAMQCPIEALRDLRASADGPVRYCVGIAMGRRGDASVRPDMKAVLQDTRAGYFRAWAAEVLGVVGDTEDVAFLRTVAESDSLRRELPPPVVPEAPPEVFPVRDAASRALARLAAGR